MMLHIFNVCLIYNISIRHIYSWIEFSLYGSILRKLNILCHKYDWRCYFIWEVKICFMWLNQGSWSKVIFEEAQFIVSSKNFCFPLVMTFLCDPWWEYNNDKWVLSNLVTTMSVPGLYLVNDWSQDTVKGCHPVSPINNSLSEPSYSTNIILLVPCC